MIHIKTSQEIELMRVSGFIAASILKKVAEAARPRVSTYELNTLAEKLIWEYDKKYGAVRSSFKGHGGFPAVLCTSLNSTIVHGVPGKDVVLKEGDSIGLDFGVTYKGWHSDTAVTLPVGSVDSETHRIIHACKKALKIGIKKARPGNTSGDIGNTIERFVTSAGYEVIKDLCGHGVGRELHEDPEIPNFGERHKGVTLQAGMVIAIEPMIVKGKNTLHMSKDGHGYETKQAELNAHFEDTILITEHGSEVLTSARARLNNGL